MVKHITLSAILTLSFALTGCIQRAEDHPISRALPKAEDVKIKLPEGGAANSWALGQVADYYKITRNISRGLNGGAAWVLIVVHAIVQFPPTTVDGDTYTWGPWGKALDPADYRLVVTDKLDGSYDWALEGDSRLDSVVDFKVVISGNAVPGDEPHRGNGNFLIDFDASKLVNPIDHDDNNKGTVEIVYDLENRDNTPATLAMTINSRQLDENGVEMPVNFEYRYAENLDGSGDLVFAIHGDLDDGGTAFEDATIRSRWTFVGEGRADIRVSGGDLLDTVVTASECWNSTFRRVYYSDSQQWQPTEGVESDCAFADQDLPAE